VRYYRETCCVRKSHCVLVIKRDAGGLVRDHRPGEMSAVRATIAGIR
jgi:hypothetical protein